MTTHVPPTGAELNNIEITARLLAATKPDEATIEDPQALSQGLLGLVAEIRRLTAHASAKDAEIAGVVAYRDAAEEYILRLRQIVYCGKFGIRERAIGEIETLQLAGKLEAARAALAPYREAPAQ